MVQEHGSAKLTEREDYRVKPGKKRLVVSWSCLAAASELPVVIHTPQQVRRGHALAAPLGSLCPGEQILHLALNVGVPAKHGPPARHGARAPQSCRHRLAEYLSSLSIHLDAWLCNGMLMMRMYIPYESLSPDLNRIEFHGEIQIKFEILPT